MPWVQAMRIDHFEGADGAIIWLDVDAPGDLSSLLSIFRSLASADSKEVELCTALPARIDNLGGLRLCVAEGSRLPRKRLVRTRSYERPSLPGPRMPSFVWSDYGDGWNRCAEIVASMIERGDPDRRDLTREGIDDAIVDLSYRATSAHATNGSVLGRGGATRLPLRKRLLPGLDIEGSFGGALRTACVQRLARGFRGAATCVTPASDAGCLAGARTP